MTKNNKGLIITIIVLLCIVVLLLSGLMVFLIAGNHNAIGFSAFEGRSQTVYDESFDNSQIKNLIVNSDCGDIDIKRSTNQEIRIVARGGKAEYFTLDNTEDTITVSSVINRTYNTVSFFKSPNIYQDIDIYLPDNCIERLEINASCGDVEIDSSMNCDLKIDCDFGDISAKRLEGTVNIQTACGDIEIKELSLTSDSFITTDLGDIEIKRTNDIRIDYDTSLGDCDVRNNNSSSEITLTAETSMGDIEIND